MAKMDHPFYRAEEVSYQDFEEWFEGFSAIDWQDRRWRRALAGALRNPSPEDRVAIASLLLDHGSDPSVVIDDDNINVLHVLFSGLADEHDFELEAPLLRRLLDGGADINLRSPRFGYPLEALSWMAATDDDLQPFYDVVFARPDIDMSAIINKHGSTLGELLTSTTRPDMTRRAEEYMERTEGRNE